MSTAYLIKVWKNMAYSDIIVFLTTAAIKVNAPPLRLQFEWFHSISPDVVWSSGIDVAKVTLREAWYRTNSET